MNRRAFISLLMSSAIAHTLDIDKLLWVPGQKTIFIPPVQGFKGMSYSAIVAEELSRITPHIRQLFERDDLFYQIIKHDAAPRVSSRDMRIPLEFKNE